MLVDGFIPAGFKFHTVHKHLNFTDKHTSMTYIYIYIYIFIKINMFYGSDYLNIVVVFLVDASVAPEVLQK